jgi:cytochrome c biogenesis protein CcmG/thiol:disulfide interchange protein DsbE
LHRLRLVGQGLAIGLVAVLLGLLVWKVVENEGETVAQAVARGEQPPAPDFTLPPLDGNADVSLSSLRGRPVVVNFWASWCDPCKDEAPFLQQMWERYRERGLVVIGVDTNDFRRDARRFVGRYGLTFPIAYDGPGKARDAYGVTGFPETYVVDPEGRVIDALVGGINTDEDRSRLERAVQSVLSPR